MSYKQPEPVSTLVYDLWRDVSYAALMLAKNPTYTAVIIFTVALGIGSCATVYSLVDAVLFQSFPYDQPARLAYLFTPIANVDLPPGTFGPSNGDFFDIKRQSHSFLDMSHFQQAVYSASATGSAERIGAAKVDSNFFRTLGVEPELGRAIMSDDEQPGAPAVAVVSHGTWQAMFGRCGDILERSIGLDGSSYHIVGVMPDGFAYPHKAELAQGNGHIELTQVWVPLVLTPRQMRVRDGIGPTTIVRLKGGITDKAARSDVTSIISRLNKLHSADMQTSNVLLSPFLQVSLGPIRPLMLLLVGSVCLVFLIACANAAGLMLAHGAGRSHELAVKSALGASRSRLIRQMLTESLIVSMSASIVGVMLAWLLLRLLLRLAGAEIPRMQDAVINPDILAFLVPLSILTPDWLFILHTRIFAFTPDSRCPRRRVDRRSTG